MNISLFELQFRQISVVFNDDEKIVKIDEKPYGNFTILLYRRGSKKIHLEQTLELSTTQFRSLQSSITPETLESGNVNYYEEIYDTLQTSTFTNYGPVDNITYSQLQPLDIRLSNKEIIPPIPRKLQTIQRLFKRV